MTESVVLVLLAIIVVLASFNAVAVTYLFIACLRELNKLTAPTVGLSLPRGESAMRIIYRDVPVPANPNAQQNTAKTRVYSKDDGGLPVLQKEIVGNGGVADIIVTEGASGDAYYTYVDGSANMNESPPSPVARYENASDQVPPSAPAGALTLPQGDSIPDA